MTVAREGPLGTTADVKIARSSRPLSSKTRSNVAVRIGFPRRVENLNSQFTCTAGVHRICSGKRLIRDAAIQACRCLAVHQVSVAVQGEYPQRVSAGLLRARGC